jgi:UDP-N-acetylmuramoyl-tripeptide--D-alanyl-D-alanine ligase
VLAPLGEVVAPPGSFNNELGHPWTVLRATESTDYLVLELSARHPGNVAALASIAPPSIAVVLNVGTAHLGEFGSREAIAATKAELPQAVPSSGVVILNVDDTAVAAMADQTAARVVRVGRTADADVWAGPVTLDALARPRFRLRTAGGEVDVQLAVHGEHQVSNALCAAAVALECGASLEQVAAALAVGRPGVQTPHAGRHPRRRRHGHQRRLQRQPGLHAGRAESAGRHRQRSARKAAQLGRARRDGGARRRRDIRA